MPPVGSSVPVSPTPARRGLRCLTEGQLAEQLGVSRLSLWRWRKRPHRPLPCVKLGDCVRYPEDRVLEWLARECEITGARNAPVSKRASKKTAASGKGVRQ